MNRKYSFFNPDSLAALAGEEPEQLVLCRKHYGRFVRDLRMRATKLSITKGEKTMTPCKWCEDPEDFED